MPERLDLRDLHVLRAKELRVKLVIGTNAHSAAQLEIIRFGVGVAHRGWCQAEHVVNTRSVGEIRAFLEQDREKRS